MTRFHKFLLAILIGCSFLSNDFAQKPKKWTSGDIHEAIKKLSVLGSAMYVAAHPDDENQRLIAYLSNELKVNTAYLAMTRGDGGQNEIGPEIRELLGVIRTQELLAARGVDGGKQLFTRANDFGYSKNPDETLRIWNKEEVLSDVVWAIRKFHPDVIINRFQHNTPGRTHGHHTSSALLSYEAFDLAADKNAFPHQLKYVGVWQPKRLFFNTHWWFYGSREKFEQVDKSSMVKVDVGVYYPIKGKSNNEIAIEARSMHRAQGFGGIASRGSEDEYLELLKGDMPQDRGDIFEGINTTWSRVKGGEPIGQILKEVGAAFQYEDPSASVPKLLEAFQLIKALPDGYWKRVKLTEIKDVIAACLGMYLEAVATDFSATPGQEIGLKMEAINRSEFETVLKSVEYFPNQLDSSLNLVLGNNTDYKFKKRLTLPKDIGYTNAYWLNKKAKLGLYTVEDQQLRGLPETPRALKVAFHLELDGVPMAIVKDVVFKKSDPVKGEVYRPFEITPPVFANIKEDVYVFANQEPRTIQILLKSGAPNISGTVELDRPNGWKVAPDKIEFQLKSKGEEKLLNFELYPPEQQDENWIKPIVRIGERTYSKKLVSIEYDHIPVQTMVLDAESKVVRIDLHRAGEKVAYIMGTGDNIPVSLTEIGYQVDILKGREINLDNLKNYDAVILGVRVYNVLDRMKFYQPELMEYVAQGGTLIAQYNKNFRLKVPMEDISPFPLKISRDRVTVEEAEVRFLKPDHEVLNSPNKITEKDFEGWVQERGLYFPNEWDEHFEAILSCNDPDESPKNGGLLVAKYGEGYYIYTGYSWFRELPAGVPGAYRLFTNLISIGKKPRP